MSQEYQTPATDDKSLNLQEAQWSGKTPIQMLHEYGTASGTPPVYVMEKAEGSGHQPHFFFSVTVGDINCTGQGSTKKAARHQAADAALKMLNLDPEKVITPGRSDSNGIAAETNFNANSMYLLQELAIQRGWRRPEYTILAESGPPHQREFTVACRFESLTEQGVGSSKKTAKRVAAEKIVAKLQSLSGGSEITWSPKSGVPFENIRNSTAEKISLLRRNPLSIPNTDYIQMVLELSKEQGFEVTYFDIGKTTAYLLRFYS
ncbi:interferon-inducible double-stranded RNA-dependent protein kinase activator A homolog, partial [Austrofundulus limnaeus]|uniref:Interferon-inducible double-stranded RNA-dependent protein kinase activator A homolog n=1 Tax=Austrofundulus limnaeus TaxID=52670 RepID=A0A2I4AN46_AUSLI